MNIRTHTCEHCGWSWKSLTDSDARQIIKAAQINGQGPWCMLCHHLKMAESHATLRHDYNLLAYVRGALGYLEQSRAEPKRTSEV